MCRVMEDMKIYIERLASHMDRRQKTWSPDGYLAIVAAS